MSDIYHTPLPYNFALTSASFNSRLAELDSALDGLVTGATSFTQLNLGDGYLPGTNILTISGGVINVSKSYHIIDVESGTSDDLDTIVGATGDELYLTIASAARTVTVKHNTGNIYLSSGGNIGLLDPNKPLHLFRVGSSWVDMGGGGYTGIEQVILPRTPVVVSENLFSFPVLPSHRHLRLLLELRMSSGAANIDVKFNNDAVAANYFSIESNIHHSNTVSTSENLGATAGLRIPINPSTAPTGYVTFLDLIIFNYASSTIPRSIRWEGYQQVDGGTGDQQLKQGGGTWKNTSTPINVVSVAPVAGSSLDAACAWAIYGRL